MGRPPVAVGMAEEAATVVPPMAAAMEAAATVAVVRMASQHHNTGPPPVCTCVLLFCTYVLCPGPPLLTLLPRGCSFREWHWWEACIYFYSLQRGAMGCRDCLMDAIIIPKQSQHVDTRLQVQQLGDRAQRGATQHHADRQPQRIPGTVDHTGSGHVQVGDAALLERPRRGCAASVILWLPEAAMSTLAGVACFCSVHFLPRRYHISVICKRVLQVPSGIPPWCQSANVLLRQVASSPLTCWTLTAAKSERSPSMARRTASSRSSLSATSWRSRRPA